MSRTSFFLLLGATTAAGLLLRLLQLNFYSYWLDEVLTLNVGSSGFFQYLENINITNPPFFFLLLNLWISLFGKGEFAVRLLSVIFGAASILLTGLLARLLYDRQTALLAAFFSAVMVFPVHYSREARSYSLFLFTTIGSFYFFVKLLQNQHAKKRDVIAYLLFTIVTCYTHNYWIFTIVAQNIFVFLKRKDFIRRWIALQLGVGILLIPWLAMMLPRAAKVLEVGFWIPDPKMSAILMTFRSFIAYLVHPSVVWLYLLLAIVGAASHWFRKPNTLVTEENVHNQTQASVLLILWLLCPIILPLLFSKFFIPIYWFRFTVAATPPFYVLLSRGILALPGKVFRAAVLSIVCAVSGVSLHNYYFPRNQEAHERSYYEYPREKWREFIPLLHQQSRPADVVVFFPSYYAIPYEYYSGRNRLRVFLSDTPLRHLERFIRDSRTIWVVYCDVPRDNERDLLDWLDRRYPKRRVTFSVNPVTKGQVFRYDVYLVKK